MEEQIYAIGEQDFVSIREAGKVYIDKTGIMHHLVRRCKHVFLARPRRFGKSLLLSTLKAYFQGRKELFEGLAIYDLEKDWKKHPVLHLSLSGTERNNFESLEAELNRQFTLWENDFGLPKGVENYSSRFRDIITGAYKVSGEKVVILVDEYDNPLINSLDNNPIHEKFKNKLKSVYSALKDLDQYIRFSMITGVSRFSKTSIFSGLNNLNDISFDNEYSAICGFTLDEIKKFMWPGVVNLAEKRNLTLDEALKALKTQYDGYHFSEECPDIYNPFSLLNALSKRNLGDYWIMSGTPEFLIRKLDASDIDFAILFNSDETEETLGTNDVAMFSPVALLYQTGYLTIKDYDPESRLYSLRIPNREVNYGLFSALLKHYSGTGDSMMIKGAIEMRKNLINGEPDKFLERLKSFFAGIPYSLHPDRYELNFEKILFSMMRLLNMDVQSEAETSDGRIDMLIKTDRFIYIIELKMDADAEVALEQIERRDYALQFEHDDRKVFKIGVSVSSETRNIENWIVK